jgi:hypothetical protein
MSFAEVDLPTGGGTGTTGRVQLASKQVPGGGDSIAATFATPVASGNAVIGCASYETALFSYPTSVTDDKGNAYTILSRISNTVFAQDQIVFFRPNITNAPVTVTVNLSDTEIARAIIIHEVDNVASFDEFGTLDHQAFDGFDLETQSTIPALTPAENNSYLFGCAHLPGDIETNPFMTPADDWTKVRETGGRAGNANAMTAERILASPTSVEFTWTNNLGRDVLGTMAVFSPRATVLAPAVTLTVTSANFGNQPVGTSSTAQVVGLSNTGTDTLTITSIAVIGANSGDFSQTNTCGGSVAAGSSCNINITFKPTAAGARIASVSIADDAANSPHSVALTGTGTETDFSLAAASGASRRP